MSDGVPRPSLTELALRHVVAAPAVMHYGERLADMTACGSTSANRTIFTRNVTCVSCKHRRALRDAITRLSWDGAACRNALVRHVRIKGNDWWAL